LAVAKIAIVTSPEQDSPPRDCFPPPATMTLQRGAGARARFAGTRKTGTVVLIDAVTRSMIGEVTIRHK
jgi:hypothetical protein